MNDTTSKKTPAVVQHDEGLANHVGTGSKKHSTRRVPAMCEKCGAVRDMSARFTWGRVLNCECCGRRTGHFRVDRIAPEKADSREEVNRRRNGEIAAILAEIEYSKDLLAKLGIAIEVVHDNTGMVTVSRSTSRPELILADLDKRRGVAWIRRDLTLHGFAKALRKVCERMAYPDMDGWTVFVRDPQRDLLPSRLEVFDG